MPAAVALSQCMGVGGCGWPSSSSVSLIIFASFAFKKIAPNSASAADSATNLRIVQSVRIGLFRRMGRLSSGCQPRKKWHPGQEDLADYVSKHHDAKHHKTVRPLYLHEINSPRELLRAMTPRVLRGCVGTKLGGSPRLLCGLENSLVPEPRTHIPGT